MTMALTTVPPIGSTVLAVVACPKKEIYTCFIYALVLSVLRAVMLFLFWLDRIS